MQAAHSCRRGIFGTFVDTRIGFPTAPETPKRFFAAVSRLSSADKPFFYSLVDKPFLPIRRQASFAAVSCLSSADKPFFTHPPTSLFLPIRRRFLSPLGRYAVPLTEPSAEVTAEPTDEAIVGPTVRPIVGLTAESAAEPIVDPTADRTGFNAASIQI